MCNATAGPASRVQAEARQPERHACTPSVQAELQDTPSDTQTARACRQNSRKGSQIRTVHPTDKRRGRRKHKRKERRLRRLEPGEGPSDDDAYTVLPARRPGWLYPSDDDAAHEAKRESSVRAIEVL